GCVRMATWRVWRAGPARRVPSAGSWPRAPRRASPTTAWSPPAARLAATGPDRPSRRRSSPPRDSSSGAGGWPDSRRRGGTADRRQRRTMWSRLTGQHDHGEAMDLTLAGRCRDGAAGAFEELYRLHAARLYGLARRLVGPNDADDVLQEIFLTAHRKLGQY